MEGDLVDKDVEESFNCYKKCSDKDFPPGQNGMGIHYWKGLVVVQNRILIVGRLNGAIAGTLQLVLQPLNNEAQKRILNISSHFVAPWARGYGLAKNMIDYAEKVSKENGASCIQLDIRETQKAAIQLFKSKGYEQWGSNPSYASVADKTIKGLYFYKKI